MTHTATEIRTAAPPTPIFRALQVTALLSVLVVLFQFITAGQLFPAGGPVQLHAAGAIAVHITSGLAAIAAVVLWRQSRLGLGLAILAVLVFGFTFLQAYIGGYNTLYLHIPGAMLLSVGVTWLFVATVRRSRA